LRDSTLRTAGATAVLAAVAVIALVQAGPGDASPADIDPTVSTSSSEPGAEPTTTTSRPFEYHIGLLGAPSTDNFWAFYGRDETVWNAYVLGRTKPALFATDASGSLVPDIAASSTPVSPVESSDGWVVDLEIGSGSWSDGAPLTARDFEFTFDTVRRLSLGGSWKASYPPNLVDATATSDHHLQLVFAREPGVGEWPYAVGLAPVMPEHAWSAQVDSIDGREELYALSGAQDVSGGALIVVESDPAHVSATVNHERVDSMVDTVVYSIFDSEAAAVDALAAGEIATILSPNGLSAAAVERLSQADGVTLVDSPANAVRYLGFNLDRFPMDDGAFREAVDLLYDREGAVTSITPDAAPAMSVLNPANEAWNDDDRLAELSDEPGGLKGRLATAMEGLEAAGYTWAEAPSVSGGEVVPGKGLEIQGRPPAPLTILTPGDLYDPDRPEYAEELESVVEALGFDVRPVVTDFDTVVDLAFTPDEEDGRQYDMYLLGWTLGNPVYPDFYGPLFTSGGEANSTGYNSKRFDRLWRLFIGSATDGDARQILWDMEELISDDLPYLTLYHPLISEAYRSDVVQFSKSPTLGGIQGSGGGLDAVMPAG
jgi:ABC-type transport system substrate-binding protein